MLGRGDREAQALLGVGAAPEPAQRLGTRDVDVRGPGEARADLGGDGDRLVERCERAFVGALVRAREAEALQELELVAELAAGLAVRGDRLGERGLGVRVVGLAHRPVAAQPCSLAARSGGDPSRSSVSRARRSKPSARAKSPVAQELGGAAQVGVEAVGHVRRERYATRSAPL